MTPNRVIAMRKALGRTQSECAALAGVHLRTWQKWEGGETSPRPQTWELLLIKTREVTPNADLI